MAANHAYKTDGHDGPRKQYHWPVQAQDFLREKWGVLPASKIAARINAEWPGAVDITKNSVISKAHKLDLPTQRRG